MNTKSHEEQNTVKVNLGCGARGLPDWINIDGSLNVLLSQHRILMGALYKLRLIDKSTYEMSYPTNVRRLDVTKGLPFPNESVDYIYTSHMLEHLFDREPTYVLKECYRVLKVGGYIRIVVPDLEFIVQKYIERDCAFFNVHSSDLIARKFVDELHFSLEKPTLNPITLLHRYFIRFWPHWNMFDYSYLRSILFAQGFIDIVKKSFKQGVVPDIEFLDQPDKWERHSIFIEAKKSSM